MGNCYLGCGLCQSCPCFKSGKTSNGSFVECSKYRDNKEPSIEDYDNIPTSDLFAIVAEECQKETILSVAEGYIGEQNIREFLFACLGFNIE